MAKLLNAALEHLWRISVDGLTCCQASSMSLSGQVQRWPFVSPSYHLRMLAASPPYRSPVSGLGSELSEQAVSAITFQSFWNFLGCHRFLVALIPFGF